MPSRETTLTFLVEGQEDEADWQAAQPLDYVFVGLSVVYEEK